MNRLYESETLLVSKTIDCDYSEIPASIVPKELGKGFISLKYLSTTRRRDDRSSNRLDVELINHVILALLLNRGELASGRCKYHENFCLFVVHVKENKYFETSIP